MKTSAFALLLFMACARSDDDPLTGAVRAGDVPATVSLLRAGADPNRASGVNDWPPLMHAVHKNQLATAEALLEYRADVNGADPRGVTPLMMAAGYGDDAMVKLLLRHHANPDLRSKNGSTALDLARTGVADIDNFTLFHRQDSTVAILRAASHP